MSKNSDRVLIKLDDLYRAIKHNVTTIQNSSANPMVMEKAIKTLRNKIEEYVDLVITAINTDAIGADPFLLTTRGLSNFPLADQMIKNKLTALRAADPNLMTAVDIVEIKAAKEGGSTITGKLKNGVKWRYDRIKNVLILSYWYSRSYISMAWTKVAQFVRQIIDWCKSVAKADNAPMPANATNVTIETQKMPTTDLAIAS